MADPPPFPCKPCNTPRINNGQSLRWSCIIWRGQAVLRVSSGGKDERPWEGISDVIWCDNQSSDENVTGFKCNYFMKRKSKYSYEEMVLTIRDILMKVFPVMYFDEWGLGAKVYLICSFTRVAYPLECEVQGIISDWNPRGFHRLHCCSLDLMHTRKLYGTQDGLDGHDSDECGAINSRCNACRKTGHLSRVCKSTKKPQRLSNWNSN